MTPRGAGSGPAARRRPAFVALAGAVLLAGACASTGSDARTAGASTTTTEEDRLVPPGYGTLPQDEVTLSLRHGDLLLKVTPLAEEVIRLTAPDTYDRLAGLKATHREPLARRSGSDRPTLFVVSFFSYEPDVPFEPEDVHLLNRGLRFRPSAIRPVTPGWGTQRLSQERMQMAVYAFPPEIDLDQELEVEYQGVRRGGWDRILRVIEAERARVRARSRSGARDRAARSPDQRSRSYLRIFR